MRNTVMVGAALAAAVVVVHPQQAARAAGTLTVEDAVARALRDNPRLNAARRRLQSSDEATTAAGRRMLPMVHVSEEFQHYDSPFVVGFGPGTAFQVRDQNTNTFSASAVQPVVGLLRLNSDRGALAEGRAASEAALAAAEADLRETIQTEFLRTFEAQAMKRIAETSAAELGDQVTVARAHLATGVITNASSSSRPSRRRCWRGSRGRAGSARRRRRQC